MALHGRNSMSNTAQLLHVVVGVGASDSSSPQDLSLLLQPDQTHALSFCVKVETEFGQTDFDHPYPKDFGKTKVLDV